MLEQTKKNGRVYDVRPGEKSVMSRPAVIPDFEFGPYRPVTIYRMMDQEMWVKDEAHGDWYHYKGDSYDLILEDRNEPQTELPPGSFYLYGVAGKGEEVVPYFVQDMPYVQKQMIPDTGTMQMPFSMLALDYERIFTYPQALKDLLRECPVAYADRFKRPVKRYGGHTYPISLAKDASSWNDLPDSNYPVVANLEGTHFAVLDLEPIKDADEEATYESIMGYYEEETIRGGRHKLVRLDDETFKFRYGKGLELIANGMITFYGINGRMLSSNPPPMKTTGFAPVGHTTRLLKPMDMPKEIGILVERMESFTKDLDIVKTRILERHRLNADNSEREFRILLDLYREVAAPHASDFPKDVLPWMLAACGSSIIEPREKHGTQRNGVPYLVYLSAIICESNEKEGAKIWTPI